jgi:hypothetical protein
VQDEHVFNPESRKNHRFPFQEKPLKTHPTDEVWTFQECIIALARFRWNEKKSTVHKWCASTLGVIHLYQSCTFRRRIKRFWWTSGPIHRWKYNKDCWPLIVAERKCCFILCTLRRMKHSILFAAGSVLRGRPVFTAQSCLKTFPFSFFWKCVELCPICRY